MITVESLRSFGADVDDGLARCMDNEEFYLGLVSSVASDTKISELGAAIAAGDLDRAFELAHALKGMLTNLALTPLSDPIVEITELLRSRTRTDYGPLLEKINAAKKAFDEL